jgi:hypothetical protein
MVHPLLLLLSLLAVTLSPLVLLAASCTTSVPSTDSLA